MKTLLVLVLLVCMATVALAGGYTKGTNMTDANLKQSDQVGLDSTKTIAATVTGTKPAFADTTVVEGTNRLLINCVNPTTGAASAARMKINNAGTEIPLNGVSGPFLIPSNAATLAFGKYSTGTATDSVKCTGYGH